MRKIESARTPAPPYYAVIFTSIRTAIEENYIETNDRLFEMLKTFPGYLGAESARNEEGLGITVSYWQDLDAIKQWHLHPDHIEAQENGRKKWYKHYKIRVCKVDREYEFIKDSSEN